MPPGKGEAERELLAWFAGGQLAVWLDTDRGLELLPYGLHWTKAGEGAALQADRVFAEGTAPSNRYPGLTGTVMVRAERFQIFIHYYLANRGLAETAVLSTTPLGAKPASWSPAGNRYWKALDKAIDEMTRRGIPPDRAWMTLKADIAAGEIKARCRARRYDQQRARWIDIWRDLDPRWLGFIAYELPQDNHLRFDPVDASRARTSGEQIDLPPEHARDIAVDAARLDELYSPVLATNPSPPWLDASEAATIPNASVGRLVARRPSRQKPFWSDARKIALEWLDEHGYPVPGDGGQAKLERYIASWLTMRGHTAVASTIREHVRAWIEEYKTSVSASE